jgi:hypothetical protein
VRFSVSDQGCDVVRREKSIAEYAWWWEAVVGLLAVTTTKPRGTNGRVAIDSEDREICSR